MLPKMGGVGIAACAMLLVCAFSSVNSFSKYGRTCNDIGCLPNEECIIASKSCSYDQRDGKECGSYPTCSKKSGAAGSSSSYNPSGSVLNPGYPHGLQPVNPYNPPFVFGQQPFYNGPGGTGGPPGGSAGILGGSGGGLAPYGSNYGGYQNPNMYNKPPPQYQNQNQNPYNRQTQAQPSAAAATAHSCPTMAIGKWSGMTVVALTTMAFAWFSNQLMLQQRTT